jgi:tetratricopeptide (TPR) repeat protein
MIHSNGDHQTRRSGRQTRRSGRFVAALLIGLCGALLFLVSPGASVRAESGPVLSFPDQLMESDLLYLSREEGDHFTRGVQLLESLRASHSEAQDEILWRLARLEKWRGDLAERAGTTDQQLVHYEKAEALAKEAIKANGKCIECHFWLGVAYGKIGQTRGVLQSLFLVSPIEREMEIVLSLNPQHSGAHHVLGVVYRLIPGFIGGSLNKSIAELALAIQLNRAGTIHYIELARSYAAAGMKQKGLEVLDALDQVTGPYDPTQAKVDRRHAAELRQELAHS